mmetsp:Transcript_16739/g.19367  ORF Transcript_16739/g.19367 Transcript_16739/m.19367 type:complete len:130 (+) Transcript_16739:262-651(+)
MKLNLVALVTILGCTTNAQDIANTCTESSGVCVCSGSCPSFTDNWTSKASGALTLGGENFYCVSLKDGGSHHIGPDSIIVNGKTYDSSSLTNCTSAIAGKGDDSAAGLFGAYYASVVVAAAAVVGVAAL